jgi:uncharacterized protein (TIGR00369 family)
MDTITNNVAGLSGLDQLRGLMSAETPPPIGVKLGFSLVEIEQGRAVFEGSPNADVYNPLGTVHGGYAATLLDSACGCAVHSSLRAQQGYTTLELKVSYHRPLSDASGPVRAEGRILSIGRRAAFVEATLKDVNGRLCASATSTLLIFDVTATAPSPIEAAAQAI